VFTLGHGKKLYNEISGIYQNCPIDLFNYDYTYGEGESSDTIHRTIFIIDFQSPVPHITLTKHQFRFFQSRLGKKVKLEGDFGDKFDFIVQEGFEIEALQIFTPDLMVKIQDEWHYELEFIGTKLIICSGGTITKLADLQKFYTAAKYLAARFDPMIDKMAPGVSHLASKTK
jgi:hypothetical protein